jgi:AcrR family transcriptional regulator
MNTKGENTRLAIIAEARDIFNAKGILLTIEKVALELGISKSRITNHFPTKDNLFMAIMNQYEKELEWLIGKWMPLGVENSLQFYINLHSEVMDTQFTYRCAIVYMNITSPSQHELKQQMQNNFTRTQSNILHRIKGMVQSGILQTSVLDEPNWSAFVFAYVNLLTQWVIYLDMYDNPEDYQSHKQKYLRGVMNHLYLPYLTKKGVKAYEELIYP